MLMKLIAIENKDLATAGWEVATTHQPTSLNKVLQ